MNSTQFLLFKGGKMGQSVAFPVARTDHKHRGAERYSTCRFNPLTVSQLKPVKKTPRLQFIIHNHGSGRCIWEVTTIRTIRDTPSHVSLNHDYGRKGSPTSWYDFQHSWETFCGSDSISKTSWWFQAIWKILVKLDHGVKINNIWNHHLEMNHQLECVPLSGNPNRCKTGESQDNNPNFLLLCRCMYLQCENT